MIGGNLLRKFLKKMERDLVAYHYTTHPIARRIHLIRSHRIDLVLDVGANVGHYGQELRGLGYRGRIVSFEPLKVAYAELERVTAGDPLWSTFNCGIGNEDGTAEINVAGNVESSSLLRMLPRHLESAPQSSYGGRETILLRRLDSMLPQIAMGNSVVYLKSDTQGYEAEVLKGGEEVLRRAVGVQLEMALVQLYESETLLADMIHEMSGRGFQLMSLEPAFADPVTGQLLQVDGVFFRPQADLGRV